MNGRSARALVATACLLVLVPAPGSAQGLGSITGTITTRAASPRPIRVSFDQQVCGAEVPDEAILVSGGRLANAVVSVAGVKAGAPPRTGTVMNERCGFIPRVQVIGPGGTMKTSSRDPVLHTTVVQESTGRQLFNVALPAPGIEISKPLGGPGVLRVGCSTHQWMRGWIVVTDESSAISGRDGTFTLTDVPPGTHQLRIWHESLKADPLTVTVAAGKTTSVAVEMK